MEKRKPISLRYYFTRTLIIFFIGVIFILAAAIAFFQIFMTSGIITPANAGERDAREEINRLSEAGSFIGELNAEYYNYIYFNADGTVSASSLEGTALSQEISRYAADNVTYATGAYVYFEDGSRCLFTWNYTSRFSDPVLRKIFPSAELLIILVTGIILIVFFLLFVRRMGRRLSDKLISIESASSQIAQQNLDTPIDASAGIKEFNYVLESMDNMREALKESLIIQWESQQQQKQEISALAHDIKTPLTIINGNAELLLEDPMADDQAKLVQSIHNAGTRAKQYVAALQQISNFDIYEEEKMQVSIESLIHDINTALSPLAKDKMISLEYVYDDNLHDIWVYPFMLMRAFINIGENAVRFTEPNGKIAILVRQDETKTVFSIQDEGPGFSKEAQQHAKEMFWQEDKSRTGSINYGIGLFIASQAAQKHTGRLVLENTSKGGCVNFYIGSLQS